MVFKSACLLLIKIYQASIVAEDLFRKSLRSRHWPAFDMFISQSIILKLRFPAVSEPRDMWTMGIRRGWGLRYLLTIAGPLVDINAVQTYVQAQLSTIVEKAFEYLPSCVRIECCKV